MESLSQHSGMVIEEIGLWPFTVTADKIRKSTQYTFDSMQEYDLTYIMKRAKICSITRPLLSEENWRRDPSTCINIQEIRLLSFINVSSCVKG